MYRHPRLVAGFFSVLMFAIVAFVLQNLFYGERRYHDAVMRADSATAELERMREHISAAQSSSDRAAASAVTAKRRAIGVLASTKPVRDTLVTIAQDSTASADTLRVALSMALGALDSVVVVADGLVVALDSVAVTHARERAAWHAVVTAADSALAAERAARLAGECRVWRFPCPSRRQSAVLAALATLVVLR